MIHSLQRFLVDYDMAMLRALAENRGVALVTNRQTTAAEQLAVALIEPGSIEMALTRLSEPGRAALDRLLAAGGRMRVSHFSRQFGEVRRIGPGRLEREAVWQHPANAAEELFYLGLICRGFLQDEWGPGEFIVIPDDLRSLLPQPSTIGGANRIGGQPSDTEGRATTAAAWQVETVPGPHPLGGQGRTCIDDMFAYLVYVYNHDVRPYADGRLGRRDTLALGLPKWRLELMRRLAERLGFVAQQRELLRIEPVQVKSWLTATPDHQLSSLQVAWRDDPAWIDLCHVPGLECDTQRPIAQQGGAGQVADLTWLRQVDPVATRKALLGWLARCPQDAWWTAASFVAAIKEADPDFQRPDGDYDSWYIREATSGQYLSGFGSWDRVEGALIADLLGGPLCWLGVVLRAGGDSSPLYHLAEPPDQEQSPSRAPIVVGPDFQVDVPAAAGLYIRFQLERLADLESAEPCRYRLTIGGLSRALARGLQVEQVLAFLQQASQQPVPVNVAGQLRLWAGRLGQVSLEEVGLLQVKSEHVLKDLSAHPQIRSLLYRVLSPTTALVRKHDLAQLEKALRDLGYLPPSQPLEK